MTDDPHALDLLIQVRNGDQGAASELMPILYAELKQLECDLAFKGTVFTGGEPDGPDTTGAELAQEPVAPDDVTRVVHRR